MSCPHTTLKNPAAAFQVLDKIRRFYVSGFVHVLDDSGKNNAPVVEGAKAINKTNQIRLKILVHNAPPHFLKVRDFFSQYTSGL